MPPVLGCKAHALLAHMIVVLAFLARGNARQAGSELSAGQFLLPILALIDEDDTSILVYNLDLRFLLGVRRVNRLRSILLLL